MPRVPSVVVTFAAVIVGVLLPVAVGAQDAVSRTALIEEAERVKSENLRPAEPGKAEAYVERLSDAFLSGNLHWHAFWTNAYRAAASRSVPATCSTSARTT